jgi:hypothetical protein
MAPLILPFQYFINYNLIGENMIHVIPQGTGLCSYYMNRGICKFGSNCKFHHPNAGSGHEKWDGSLQTNQISSGVNIYSVLDHGELNEQPVPSIDDFQVSFVQNIVGFNFYIWCDPELAP